MIANTCRLYMLSHPVPWIRFLQVYGVKVCFMLIESRSGGRLRDHTTWLESRSELVCWEAVEEFPQFIRTNRSCHNMIPRSFSALFPRYWDASIIQMKILNCSGVTRLRAFTHCCITVAQRSAVEYKG